ncbi:hypothetical protein EYC84_006990 [Monilinia fructicola]|uniref:Uncharacterized protein n=1 Tax=Monilinia fructicola TaxID=38448 RepID=A0A5M9K964_MONFR|nr:hypothetical protein EYC84_006990 [Monilinia fructicola]
MQSASSRLSFPQSVEQEKQKPMNRNPSTSIIHVPIISSPSLRPSIPIHPVLPIQSNPIHAIHHSRGIPFHPVFIHP